MTSKSKGESGRSRSAHSHGKQLAASTEPLFPRVHVSETRNGPKAPPRNKMALYEQLTIPSHHFLQPQQQPVWPPVNPSQYAAGNCYYGVVTEQNKPEQEVDRELQRVPKVVLPSEEAPVTKPASQQPVRARELPYNNNKRVRNEDDFAVPTYRDTGTNVASTASTKHVEKRTNNQNSSSNICGSTAGSDNNTDAHEEQINSGDSSASIVDSIRKISARDVIGAVGEKQFWKTRKNLLRQQRIFAAQVFELHRVLKVQHLLAKSPKLLLDPDSNHIPLLEAPQPSSRPSRVPSLPVRQERTRVRASSPPQQKPGSQNTARQSTEPLKERSHQHTVSTQQQQHTAVSTQQQQQQQQQQETPMQYPHPLPGGFPAPAPATSSWAYPGMNQWTMVPASHYVLHPTAYQPIFGAPSGYEMYPMPRPAEIPMYWQQQQQQQQAMYHPQSPGWYTLPPQYYNPATMKVPLSTGSTVMSPAPGLEGAPGYKFGSVQNSDLSSIAHSSEHQTQTKKNNNNNNHVTAGFSFLSPPSDRHMHHLESRGGMKVVPRAVMATPESAAGILKSIQRERN